MPLREGFLYPLPGDSGEDHDQEEEDGVDDEGGDEEEEDHFDSLPRR